MGNLPTHARGRVRAFVGLARMRTRERERASLVARAFGNCNGAKVSLALPLSFVKFTYFAYELEHKTETEQKQRALRSTGRAWSVGRECAGRRTCNPAWGFPWFSASRVINGYVWGCFIDVPGQLACVGSAHSTRQNSKGSGKLQRSMTDRKFHDPHCNRKDKQTVTHPQTQTHTCTHTHSHACNAVNTRH